MNALNIISGLGSSSPSSPPRSRKASSAESASASATSDGAGNNNSLSEKAAAKALGNQETGSDEDDEKAPLLGGNASRVDGFSPPPKTWRMVPKRIADAIASSCRIVITTLLAPVSYVVACFYDSEGRFSAMLPIRRLYNLNPRKRRRKSQTSPVPTPILAPEEFTTKPPRSRPKRKTSSTYAAAPAAESSDGLKSESSEGEAAAGTSDDTPARNTRSRTSQGPDDGPGGKSIRIKIDSGNTKRGHRSTKSTDGSNTEDDRLTAVAAALKSPSSPATKLKYPRAPAPPRPLVPKRSPSYANLYSPNAAPRKTLILDLDETLIHSMAKSMSSAGHMVEVKFDGVVAPGGRMLGQVPILYYVHERPHCHEFLRKVCKWFNVAVFTASVQQYADPVIDWLERERTYFCARYYRQHCTFRNGAYIKDLSQVEPDLSKVMILDNSPMSYIFQEDNAIPIEGWISDPTDNDLLHLIPFLEGLQYVTDVRALLALRMGQGERS